MDPVLDPDERELAVSGLLLPTLWSETVDDLCEFDELWGFEELDEGLDGNIKELIDRELWADEEVADRLFPVIFTFYNKCNELKL